MNDSEFEFLKRCNEIKCDFILKSYAAMYEKMYKYRMHGIKNGYIYETMLINCNRTMPLFDDLEFGKYYPIQDLMSGEQLTLL